MASKLKSIPADLEMPVVEAIAVAVPETATIAAAPQPVAQPQMNLTAEPVRSEPVEYADPYQENYSVIPPSIAVEDLPLLLSHAAVGNGAQYVKLSARTYCDTATHDLMGWLMGSTDKFAGLALDQGDLSDRYAARNSAMVPAGPQYPAHHPQPAYGQAPVYHPVPMGYGNGGRMTFPQEQGNPIQRILNGLDATHMVLFVGAIGLFIPTAMIVINGLKSPEQRLLEQVYRDQTKQIELARKHDRDMAKRNADLAGKSSYFCLGNCPPAPTPPVQPESVPPVQPAQ